jgi:hypothetical protein
VETGWLARGKRLGATGMEWHTQMTLTIDLGNEHVANPLSIAVRDATANGLDPPCHENDTPEWILAPVRPGNRPGSDMDCVIQMFSMT